MKTNMRHLDTYKIFEDKEDDIVSTLEDIALDIEDDSFDVTVKHNPPGNYQIKLTILKNKLHGLALFDIRDIYNYTKRIVDYMNSEGYITYMQIPERNRMSRVSNVDSVEDLLKIDYHITYLDMGFRKSLLRDPSDVSRIKHFESFPDFDLDETAEYIKDICLEIKDDGFTICGGSSLKDLHEMDAADVISLHGYRSSVEINKFDGVRWNPNASFEIPEVYDAVSTLINYMGSRGYKTNVYINNSDIDNAERRIYLNDITVIINKIRDADSWEEEQHGKDNLKGLGKIRYIKLYFHKDQ